MGSKAPSGYTITRRVAPGGSWWPFDSPEPENIVEEIGNPADLIMAGKYDRPECDQEPPATGSITHSRDICGDKRDRPDHDA